MRLSAPPLLLAGLLAQSLHAQAKNIEVCTQVTKQYVTNGDFVTDSDWTSSDDYTIVTKSESESGYIEIPFTESSIGYSVSTFQQTVSSTLVGPYYQMDFYWNVITDDDDVVCDLNVVALFDDDDDSEYGFITNGYLRTSTGESGWTNVLGQWKATETDITLEFKTTCTGGSGTIQVRDISYKGPEIVCTSQCDSSVLRTSGELLKDGDFTSSDFDDIWEGDTFGVAVDDDAPGGGQCMYISSEFSYYELNQTIADAQVGQTYHASAMWRLKSSSADAESYPTCTFDIRVINLDEELLLDLAHMEYTLTTDDSGWMSVNGTWNATVSSAIVNVYMNCATEQSDYYPDVEVADVHLRLQRVVCTAPSSSAIARSTSLGTSVNSTPFVRSSTVSRSISASASVSRIASSVPSSTPYSAPVTTHTTISISIPKSTQSSSVVVSPASFSPAVTQSVPVPSAPEPSRAGPSASVPSPSDSGSSISFGSAGSESTGYQQSVATISKSVYDTTASEYGSQSTTSTVFTTQTSTITACPSTVTNCPATAKTTYLTTETILVSTIVCPVTAAEQSHTTTALTADDGSYTSTILKTRTVTVTSCAATVTDCPARSRTTYTSIQTVVAGITVISAEAIPTVSSYTNTVIGIEAPKPTIAPHQAETFISADHGHANTASAANSSSPETTGASNSNTISTASSGSDTAPTANTGEVGTAKVMNDASQSNTVSTGGSSSDSTSTNPTASNNNDSEIPQGTSPTGSGATATASVFILDSGASESAYSAPAIITGSKGDAGASNFSSGSFRVSSGNLRASSSLKAPPASSTLATATSASIHHSSTAASVATAFSGAASVRAARSTLIGFVAWGLAVMFL